MKQFVWSDDGTYCDWYGLDLIVGDNGFWMVQRRGRTLSGHENQVFGSDLQDAQRRAQAAAMVLHQLSNQQHGGDD